MIYADDPCTYPWLELSDFCHETCSTNLELCRVPFFLFFYMLYFCFFGGYRPSLVNSFCSLCVLLFTVSYWSWSKYWILHFCNSPVALIWSHPRFPLFAVGKMLKLEILHETCDLSFCIPWYTTSRGLNSLSSVLIGFSSIKLPFSSPVVSPRATRNLITLLKMSFRSSPFPKEKGGVGQMQLLYFCASIHTTIWLTSLSLSYSCRFYIFRMLKYGRQKWWETVP